MGLAFNTEYFDSKFNHLKPGCIYYTLASGEFSLHELLQWLLNKVGPADLLITAFSICEESARAFHWMKDSGKARSIKILFDPSVKVNKANFLLFSEPTFDEIYFTPNHSKVILIKSQALKVTIHSSANLTINNRLECTLMDTDPETYSYFENIILNEFNKSERHK